MHAQTTAFQLAEVQPHIEKLVASFNAGGVQEIWVTEFGNVDWRRTEAEAAKLCWELSNYFANNAVGIQRWFWSRSVGYDRRFDTIGQRPFSSLLAADGKTLSTIGRIYKIASGMDTRKLADAEFAGSAPLPQKLALVPSYPNPFSVASTPSTRIAYALPQESEVSLRIYDVLGRMTRQIVQARQMAGDHQVLWDGRNEAGGVVASGIYFSVLQVGTQRLTQKIIVTR
jgi:hypothetical protein